MLAADPTWLARSIGGYYDFVDRIVVSYDEQGRGWSGRQVSSEECLSQLKALDLDRKLVLAPGSYGTTFRKSDPIEGETRQRNAARSEAGVGADWVLQIDTDEYLPSFAALASILDLAGEKKLPAVDWPMRVLYRRLRDGRFLEVANADGSIHTEYPGLVAVRPDVELTHCRRAEVPFLRPVVVGDRASLEVSRPPGEKETRIEQLSVSQVILHNSWARDARSTWRKVSTWGHSEGHRAQIYFALKWLPAPLRWKSMRDFHPILGDLWPRLLPTDTIATPAGSDMRPRDA